MDQPNAIWTADFKGQFKTGDGEYVGLEEVDDGMWSVCFGPVLIGRFDERNLTLYGRHPHDNRGKKVSPQLPVWVLPM